MRILAQGRKRLRKGDPPGLDFDSRGRHKSVRMIEDHTIVLQCCCGREYGLDFAKSKPMPLRGDGVWLLFRRWQDGSSGAPCPDCLRHYRRTGTLPPKRA